MIKKYLHKAYVLGQTVRLSDGVYRIVRESSDTLDCLQGGKGIREVTLVKTTDTRTTNELKYAEEAKVKLFEEYGLVAPV